MSGAHAPAQGDIVRRYVVTIEAHLVRIAAGHDPMGHLFGIERLARGARAEWWESRPQSEHGQHKP